MNIKKISKVEKLSAFPNLFGQYSFNGTPLYWYAEMLFYRGMNQMVNVYQGGYFDFFKISTDDSAIEREEHGFVPLIKTDGYVFIETPLKKTATVSYKSASLIVWMFVIGQVANRIDNEIIKNRIYSVIEDIKYSYPDFKNSAGQKLFSENDCSLIHQLLD